MRGNLLIGPVRYWLHHALGWLGIWIVFSIGILADPAPKIELTNVKYTAGLCLGGFFISHILRALVHRFRWESLPWGKAPSQGSYPLLPMWCCGSNVIGAFCGYALNLWKSASRAKSRNGQQVPPPVRRCCQAGPRLTLATNSKSGFKRCRLIGFVSIPRSKSQSCGRSDIRLIHTSCSIA